MLTIRNVCKMPKPPRPVCDHAQNRGLFDSVEQRFGEIIANGLGSLCRIIGLYRELRHLCRGKLILLRWEEFLDQIEECVQISGDLYQLERQHYHLQFP